MAGVFSGAEPYMRDMTSLEEEIIQVLKNVRLSQLKLFSSPAIWKLACIVFFIGLLDIHVVGFSRFT